MLLIDEIDKADIEFPNDLLRELDRMEFHVYETGETVRAGQRPIVIITLEQREGAAGRVPPALLLPLHPFSRARHHGAHHRGPPSRPAARPGRRGARPVLRDPRGAGDEERKPSTSELLDWIKLLMVDDIPPAALRANRRPHPDFRRCTGPCSRTSTTCTCSSAWPSSTAAKGAAEPWPLRPPARGPRIASGAGSGPPLSPAPLTSFPRKRESRRSSTGLASGAGLDPRLRGGDEEGVVRRPIGENPGRA